MLKNFPFPKLRPGTEEALDKIEKAFASGKRFVLLSANVGSGKSGFNVAFARKYNAHIITPNKVLQEQYFNTKEFNKEYTVFGKANYPCGISPEYQADRAVCCSDSITMDNLASIPWTDDIYNIENAPSSSTKLKSICVKNNVCDYYKLINKVSNTPGAVLNYDLFAHIKQQKQDDGRVYLGTAIAMDEAHQLFNKISSIYSFKISVEEVVKIIGKNGQRDNEKPAAWLNRCEKIATEIISKEKDRFIVSIVNNFLMKIKNIVSLPLDNSKIIHIDDDGQTVHIRPLDLSFLKDKIFFPFEKILFTSSTFQNNFTSMLGIKDDEFVQIEMENNFPIKNRPVVFYASMPALNYKSELNIKSEQIKKINSILDHHKNEKGIIHTSNYKILEQLKVIYKNNKRFIWVDRDLNKDEVLRRHKLSKEPTVIVSPAMIEGVDLKDDIARWQIVVKLPYPAIDEFCKKMMAIYPKYYENTVITNIVQTYGRAVRSNTDKAVMYILDGSFNKLYSNNKDIFPKYLTQALHIV